MHIQKFTINVLLSLDFINFINTDIDFWEHISMVMQSPFHKGISRVSFYTTCIIRTVSSSLLAMSSHLYLLYSKLSLCPNYYNHYCLDTTSTLNFLHPLKSSLACVYLSLRLHLPQGTHSCP